MIPFIWHFRKGKTVGTEIGSVTASSYWLAEGQTRMGRKELFMVIEGFCISIVVVVTGLLHLSKLTEMYTLKGWILMHINHTSINKQKIYNLPQKMTTASFPFHQRGGLHNSWGHQVGGWGAVRRQASRPRGKHTERLGSWGLWGRSGAYGRTEERAHRLIPGHKEWGTEVEETLWLGTGYIKQIHKISKYTEGKRSQVSPYLRMLIHLQKRRDWLNLRWSHSHEFWFIIENSMFSHINIGPTLTHTHMQTPCTHTCIHIYTHIQKYTKLQVYMLAHTCVCVCTVCTCILTYIF